MVTYFLKNQMLEKHTLELSLEKHTIELSFYNLSNVIYGFEIQSFEIEAQMWQFLGIIQFSCDSNSISEYY